MANSLDGTIRAENPRDIWRRADAVCFDVDSTVSRGEGLQDLGVYLDVSEAVRAIDQQIDSGRMQVRESLVASTNLLRPTRKVLDDFIQASPPQLTTGIKELVRLLQQNETPVYLISGGFRSIIEPMAAELGVPMSNVFANRFRFHETGEFAGIDLSEPTSQSHGKGKVVGSLKERFGYKTVVMVGDGVPDMQAAPPADLFIGFGGNIVRDLVKREAAWYVTDFKELIDSLH